MSTYQNNWRIKSREFKCNAPSGPNFVLTCCNYCKDADSNNSTDSSDNPCQSLFPKPLCAWIMLYRQRKQSHIHLRVPISLHWTAL
ncbi:hypothetical protein DPMN_122827 [Dreissena polymorpha]|uniref:Uncharacterized protein n=1 Tax=Dreissena polymorpha TaxID=45954 RepID=A0A9D4GT64_DREPO|nr:hypothetical protein DPMN_122827 [Dreissena polymorpha]